MRNKKKTRQFAFKLTLLSTLCSLLQENTPYLYTLLNRIFRKEFHIPLVIKKTSLYHFTEYMIDRPDIQCRIFQEEHSKLVLLK